MDYRPLGTTGVRVSALCFGTMSFGGDADEATSRAIFDRCREAGINFFDCANVYASGRSEEILGRLAASCRDELVLTSKAFFPTTPDDPNALSPAPPPATDRNDERVAADPTSVVVQPARY